MDAISFAILAVAFAVMHQTLARNPAPTDVTAAMGLASLLAFIVFTAAAIVAIWVAS